MSLFRCVICVENASVDTVRYFYTRILNLQGEEGDSGPPGQDGAPVIINETLLGIIQYIY